MHELEMVTGSSRPKKKKLKWQQLIFCFPMFCALFILILLYYFAPFADLGGWGDELDDQYENEVVLNAPAELSPSKTEPLPSTKVPMHVAEVIEAMYAIHVKAAKKRGEVILLHGAAFSSETWVNLNTLQVLSKEGYDVFAVDLPGYGKSSELKLNDKEERLDFMKNFILYKGLDKPVVVSPSMSGSFSIPLLMRSPEMISGYVGVAPVLPSEYSKQDFAGVNKASMSIYGSKDSMGKRNSVILGGIPHIQTHILEGAGHPCYLEKSDEFHSLIKAFLKQIYRS